MASHATYTQQYQVDIAVRGVRTGSPWLEGRADIFCDTAVPSC